MKITDEAIEILNALPLTQEQLEEARSSSEDMVAVLGGFLTEEQLNEVGLYSSSEETV